MEATAALNRIQRLPIGLANQIAAGEVVERPASVVKELLENSLDAGAVSIHVDVEQGGARLMKIKDDGCGIRREDMELALSRHATSKIASLDDLETVRTLGFRGEALPSVASVSRLSLTSRVAEADLGWRIYTEGDGSLSTPEPAAHSVGTTVEVRDLFFNTPARRKFLRSEKTEFNHVEDVVRRLALVRFDTEITLRHNGRNVLALRSANSPEERTQRVARVCGGAFVQHALVAEFEGSGLYLTGWVVTPDFSRGQSDLQYFFVNGRMVRDRVITHAIRHAYRGLVPEGRYPAYALYLELDPGRVDVNVHPTKNEVRFRETRLVHDFIRRSLDRALSSTHMHDTGRSYPSLSGVGVPALHGVELPERYSGYRAWQGSSDERPLSRVERAQTEKDAPPLGHALGQLHEVYILAQNQKGVVLVNIAAAREYVLRARLSRGLRANSLRSQPLLVPLTLTVSNDQAEATEQRPYTLTRLGFELFRAGPDSVSVRQIPTHLASADVGELIRDVLARIQSLEDDDCVENALEPIIDAIARHGVPPKHGCLTLEEMDALLRDLEDNQNEGGTVSRHPTWIQITLEELRNRFSRAC